jgi:DNA sulfur modification protein DndD
MRIAHIKFNDFRMFRGNQSIEFSTENSKNCSVYVASNGGGKTTLLNALIWAMYGEFTPDFQLPEQLLSYERFDELEVGDVGCASVELKFRQGNRTYFLRREAYIRNSDGRQAVESTSSTMSYIGPDGGTHFVENADHEIRQLYPRALAEYFFFNGERLNNLMSHEFQDLEEPIEAILKLEQFKRAVIHIPRVEAEYDRQIAELVGDDALKSLVSERDFRRQKLERLQETVDSNETRVRELSVTREGVVDRLRQLSEVEEFQRRRDELEKERRNLIDRVNSLHTERRQLFSERSATVFMAELGATCSAHADQLRNRGELPAPVKTQFIDDLLEKGECICGAPLVDGSAAHTRVSTWRNRAGHVQSEEEWIRVGAWSESVKSDLADFRQRHQRIDESLNRELRDLRQLDIDISDASERIDRADLSEARELNAQLKRCESSIQDLMVETRLAERDSGAISAEISSLDRQIREVQAKAENVEEVRRYKRIMGHALKALSEYYTVRREHIRLVLENEMDKIYQSIATHDFRVLVRDDFKIRLVDREGKDVAPGTGELHALYLAFISALSKVGQILAKPSSSVIEDDFESFPIVADAVLGVFGKDYQKNLLAGLPTLSHQLVLLLNDAQGEGLETQLGDRLGRFGVMTIFTSKQSMGGGKLEEKDLTFGGIAYPLIRISEKYDYSTIERCL